MTRFLDGPAAGVVLCLRRAPLYLRVVQGVTKEFDALDQPDDEPRLTERLFAYRRVGEAGTVHVDGRDKKGKRFGAWYATAEYKLLEEQPGDDTMRETEKWRAWAIAQANGLKESMDGR